MASLGAFKTWKFCEQFVRLFWKPTPFGKIFKILFRQFTWRQRLTLIVVFKCLKICPTGNRWNRALFTWPETNKISAATQTVATARIALKICQGQLPQHLAHIVPAFHPNRSVHFRWSYSRTREDRFCPICDFRPS